MALFHNCGLFWRLEDVDFGRPGAGGDSGKLLGKAERSPSRDPIDFSQQIGVYALYADFTIVYTGQVGGGGNNRLLARLRVHAAGSFKGRWNRFSWFGLRKVLDTGKLSKENAQFHPSRLDVLNHVEGIILQFAEPPLNGQDGRFGNEVKRFLQVRDPRLGKTTNQEIAQVHSWLKTTLGIPEE